MPCCYEILLWNLQKTLTWFFSKSILLTLLPSNCSSVIFCLIPKSHISFWRHFKGKCENERTHFWKFAHSDTFCQPRSQFAYYKIQFESIDCPNCYITIAHRIQGPLLFLSKQRPNWLDSDLCSEEKWKKTGIINIMGNNTTAIVIYLFRESSFIFSFLERNQERKTQSRNSCLLLVVNLRI